MQVDLNRKSAADKTELYASGREAKFIFARIWRGRTRAKDYAAYTDYLYEFGVLKIERMPGNLGVQMFRAITDDIAEFTVISFWPTREAIQVWSGDDLTRTRHLEKDPEYLLELPNRVTLVEVCANDWHLAVATSRAVS
jgi:heme-degrading monooxygenase HmoA